MTYTYQLKVTPRGSKPAIWRRLIVPADKDRERHTELAEWVPAGWAPEPFDLALANGRVAKHQPQPGLSRSANTKRPSRTRARARS